MPPSQSKQRFADNLTPPSQMAPKKSRSGLAALLSAGVCVVLAALIILSWQPVSDWWRLRDYHPPASISRLADQDTMTPYARHLFYLNKPQLLSSVGSFRRDCPENEDAIVLGCYHPNQDGIYIYDVKTADLQGVSQVTAAHEGLHAIYERLSDKDRRRVDGLLEDYYKHGLTNQRVKDEIKLYQKDEPKAVVNEMHSVFGTEVSDLPPALESYYRQYFNDRSVIVAFSNKYEQAFSARQDKINQDDRQLAAIKQQIDVQEAGLQAQQDQLTAAHRQLQSLLSAGQTEEYNTRIPTYNSQVQAYNSGISSLKDLITQYNRLVAARNAIAKELTTLDKALDTRLTPDKQAAD